MKKNEKFFIQCADCGHRHKRSVKWLENATHLECDGCDIELDIEEIMDDIYQHPEQDTFKVYPR